MAIGIGKLKLTHHISCKDWTNLEQFGDSGYHASIARSKTFLLIYCYTYINTGLGTSIEPDLNDILAQYNLFTCRSCDV
jgi:hypothetical protein